MARKRVRVLRVTTSLVNDPEGSGIARLAMRLYFNDALPVRQRTRQAEYDLSEIDTWHRPYVLGRYVVTDVVAINKPHYDGRSRLPWSELKIPYKEHYSRVSIRRGVHKTIVIHDRERISQKQHRIERCCLNGIWSSFVEQELQWHRCPIVVKNRRGALPVQDSCLKSVCEVHHERFICFIVSIAINRYRNRSFQLSGVDDQCVSRRDIVAAG